MASTSTSSSDDELIQVIDEMSKYIHSENTSKPQRSRHTSSHSSKSGSLDFSPISEPIAQLPPPPLKSGSNLQQSPNEPTHSTLDLGKLLHFDEVDLVCSDLLQRFRSARSEYPKKLAEIRDSVSKDDPLCTTIALLKSSLTRMKGFLFSLDPMKWLPFHDRLGLYNTHACTVAILRASVGFNPESAPAAYPLPYGEYLGEIEALHLILAHDLYNELRSLLAHIQELDIRELHVMLLVMMVAFFSPSYSSILPQQSKVRLKQPEKVVKVHDYYTHKLQAYLTLQHGHETCPRIMNAIITMIEKVRNFSDRLREFLCDVTRCGLQKQCESVCENIGLMAFLLQSEPL
ncbi:uncharacterized protein [Lepeophtheirus salmonis]|uniref:NR LBD domain-containing protein n=1 Tax=Lepeophtheirus salmonis TaxID=72036 RepID=A0A0K2V4H7_LEPSM|nr:uncharacterized protein LOC121122873 [Lepeophtheirus salmonis]